MSDQLDHRVTKLEFRVDGHDKEIAKVTSHAEELSQALNIIKTNLTQIKWVVIGAAGAIAVQALGVKDLVKLFFSFV